VAVQYRAIHRYPVVPAGGIVDFAINATEMPEVVPWAGTPQHSSQIDNGTHVVILYSRGEVNYRYTVFTINVSEVCVRPNSTQIGIGIGSEVTEMLDGLL